VSDKESDVTRNIEEQLSAFLDGELPQDELQLLVRRLEKDPQHRATLSRYAYAGSVLRNEAGPLPLRDLRAGVMDAVAGDEAVEPPSANSERSSQRSLMLAAAVACVAIIVGQVLPGADSLTDGPRLAGIQSAADVPNTEVLLEEAAPIAARAVGARGEVLMRKNAVSPARMTSYMVSHGEFSRKLQGTLVDSRVFARQAVYRPGFEE
jgi:anti-sigma factor RsiW